MTYFEAGMVVHGGEQGPLGIVRAVARDNSWVLVDWGPAARALGFKRKSSLDWLTPATDPKLAHRVTRWGRFVRGMTPTAPQRALLGYEPECSCGWSTRVNGRLEEAVAAHRAHVRHAVLGA